MKTRLIIVRHAEAEGNLKRIFHGWTDSDITEKGHKQAVLVAERLKNEKIDVIYSSSMKRTLKTAEYISRIKGLSIIRTDALKEINGGDWEGKKWHTLPERYPKEYDTWENRMHMHVMPNGESVKEFQERLIDELELIIKENSGKSICIVTHGTAIKSLLCFFHGCSLNEILNMPWVDNTAVTILEYDNGEFRMVLEGDASHLDKEHSTIQNQEWYEEYSRKIRKGEQD